jgi:hypothetical protein
MWQFMWQAVQAELALADLRATLQAGDPKLKAELDAALAEMDILRRDKERTVADLAVTKQEVGPLNSKVQSLNCNGVMGVLGGMNPWLQPFLGWL